MGPATSMSTTTEIKLVSTTKLADDGSNWIVFEEKLTNKFLDKGLGRHLRGTARKPPAPCRAQGETSTDPPILHFRTSSRMTTWRNWRISWRRYEQKEAKMRTIIYEAISDSTFIEIKGEATAALIWKKLVAVMTGKAISYANTSLPGLATWPAPTKATCANTLAK